MSKWNVVLVAPPCPPCCSARSDSVGRAGCWRSGSDCRARGAASGSVVVVGAVAGSDEGGGVDLRCGRGWDSVDCWARIGKARAPSRRDEARRAYGFIITSYRSNGGKRTFWEGDVNGFRGPVASDSLPLASSSRDHVWIYHPGERDGELSASALR